MKTIILILSAICLQISVINLKHWFKGEGVIFDKTENFPFRDENYAQAYSPTIDDVQKAEKIISEGYFQYRENVLDSFNSKKYRTNPKYRNPEKVIQKFYKYNRQYAGYINTKGDKIIYVGMFNFANKRKAQIAFEKWKEIIFLGSEGFYVDNQEYFEVNIDRKDFVYKISKQ